MHEANLGGGKIFHLKRKGAQWKFRKCFPHGVQFLFHKDDVENFLCGTEVPQLRFSGTAEKNHTLEGAQKLMRVIHAEVKKSG